MTGIYCTEKDWSKLEELSKELHPLVDAGSRLPESFVLSTATLPVTQEDVAEALEEELRDVPTPGQIAAVIIHLGLQRFTPEEILEALRCENCANWAPHSCPKCSHEGFCLDGEGRKRKDICINGGWKPR